MLNIFIDIFSNFIIISTSLYVWHKLINRKIDFRNIKLYITMVCLMVASISTYLLVNDFIRIFAITIVFMIFFRFLFKERIEKCILTPVFYQIMVMLSEVIFALTVFVLQIDIQITMTSHIINMVSNIFISLVLIISVNSKIMISLYNNMLKITDKLKITYLILFCSIATVFLNLFIVSAYYKIEFKYWFIFNVFLILVCFLIVIYSFKIQNNYNKVSDKYNIAIKSLNDYETMMTKYKIANHENKNLLLTIRAMVLNNEKEIPKFIDTMIEDKYADDEKLLFKMAVIPSGGLRATIYSEILKIKDNGINYSIDFDKKLKAIDLLELDTNTIIDICKIMGVFIDNAIDEVKGNSEKNILISLFVEQNLLNIKISNNYEGKININKIFEQGYTTKGNGHGNGLTLVKQIIDNNKTFEIKTEIKKDIFSQNLIVKLNKK